MNTRYLMAMLLGLAVMASSQGQETAPANGATPDKAAQAEQKTAEKTKQLPLGRTQCDLMSNNQQCCSAKNCTGNVLSNRDAHNCTRTAGKSWHPASVNGTPAACTDL
jgi:hypothetical protein